MRLALSIEYIGKKYYGWQKQNGDSTNTVQHHVEIGRASCRERV